MNTQQIKNAEAEKNCAEGKKIYCFPEQAEFRKVTCRENRNTVLHEFQ